MGKKIDGYKRVQPTREEIADWAAKHPSSPHNFPYRAQCEQCGARLWVSGLGIGSHNRYHVRKHEQEAEQRSKSRERIQAMFDRGVAEIRGRG